MKKLLNFPIFVGWDLTYRCNLSCVHCMFGYNKASKNEEMDTAAICRILEDFAENKVVSVQFAGGEPLLRKDIFTILKHATDLGLITTVATNGILCDKTMSSLLKETYINAIQISLDGLEHEHELIRADGTFVKTVNGIKNIINEEIPVSVAVLINKVNYLHMDSIINYLVSLGVNAVRLQFLLLTGKARAYRNKLYVEPALIRETVQIALNNNYVNNGSVQLILPCYYPKQDQEHSIPNDFSESSFLVNACGAGTTSINIDPYGNVSACGILTDEQWFLGNLNKSSLKDIWRYSEGLSCWRSTVPPEECNNCTIYSKCMGGCRANAWLLDGNFYGKDPYCWR